MSALLHEWAATLHECAMAWSGWALPRALQFAAAAALLLPLDRLLARRSWPRLRLALFTVALLGLVLPTGSVGFVERLAVAPLLPSAAALKMTSSPGAGPLAPPGGAVSFASGAALLFLAWLAGALLFSVGALVHHARVRARFLAADLGASPALRERVELAARRIGRVGPAGKRGLPRIVVAAPLSSPAVLGCVRPLLLIPAPLAARADGAEGRDVAELDHALLHELSHLERRDPWAAAATFLVVALWWFHPLAWFAARRCAALRELCCDDDVARLLGAESAGYRATLLAQGRRLLEPPRIAGALGFFAAPSLLVARLEQLSRPRVRRPRLERASTLVAAALVAAIAWPAAAADRGRAAPADASRGEDAALREEALAVVRASTGLSRPPGCLRLQNAVTYLRSLEERTSP